MFAMYLLHAGGLLEYCRGKKPVVISVYLQLVCEISTEIDCTGKEPYIVILERCLTMFWKEGNI